MIDNSHVARASAASEVSHDSPIIIDAMPLLFAPLRGFHRSPIALALVVVLSLFGVPCVGGAEERSLLVGVAEVDITPPAGFPMAGYYHERLAEGVLDPLWAKAIVFRDGENVAAIVVCDLIGVSTDLSREVRRRVAEETGIPADHVVVAATHSHTAPDYMKELYLWLGDADQDRTRADYIEKLVAGPVAAIRQAHERAAPAQLSANAARQEVPVAFNRRFVMRDGSVRTWQNLANPEVVRAAGPIDPEIGLIEIRSTGAEVPSAIFSNYALHLDTVGGTSWSADYPRYIEQRLRREFGDELISVFGTGCCGDINHSDPTRTERNKVDFIGTAIGDSIAAAVGDLQPVAQPRLFVRTHTVELPLQDVQPEEIDRAVELLAIARMGGTVDFFEHVAAYKAVILDHLRHKAPRVEAPKHITWGVSRSLAGVGDRLPVDVTVIALGTDVAIVCLPGEVFVDLGLAIKQASPFRTTLVVELCNAVETIYIPHRGAYAGGSYEVTNSNLEPGGGEMLVETAVRLLREAATSATIPTTTP
jgi:neutral ceramidase